MVYDPDISFGGPRGAEVEHRRREDRGAEGAEVDWCGEKVSPSTLGGLGRGLYPLHRKFFQSFIKNGVFWSILMSKYASHVYTYIAHFHFHQYRPKPTSYNYARVKTSC